MAKRKGKGGPGGGPIPGNLAGKLAQLEKQREKTIQQIQAQRADLLRGAIEKKQQELADARKAAAAARRAVASAENALYTLKVQAGLVKGARRKSGRKPRILLADKRAAVAEALKGIRSGTPFRELRTLLLSLKHAPSGGPIFATTDFNSASKFGPRFLPRGWKVKGERRDATLVKS